MSNPSRYFTAPDSAPNDTGIQITKSLFVKKKDYFDNDQIIQ